MDPHIYRILDENCAPDFIPLPEIAKAREIEQRITLLRAQSDRYMASQLKASVSRARAAYSANPTAANMMELEVACVLKASSEELSSIRVAAAELLYSFVAAEYIPWLGRVIRGAANFLSEHANKIEMEEKKRALEILGEPIGRSEIAERLRKPINEIHKVLVIRADMEGIGRTIPLPSHFLAMFGYSFETDFPVWASPPA